MAGHGLGADDMYTTFLLLGWVPVAIGLVVVLASNAALRNAVSFCSGLDAKSATPHELAHHAMGLMPEAMAAECLSEKTTRLRTFMTTHSHVSGRYAEEVCHAAHSQKHHSRHGRRSHKPRAEHWDLGHVFPLSRELLARVLEFTFLLKALYKSIFVVYFVGSDLSWGGTLLLALPLLASQVLIWPELMRVFYFLEALTEIDDEVLGLTVEEMEQAKALKAYMLRKLYAHTAVSKDWVKEVFDDWAGLANKDGVIDANVMRAALRKLDICFSAPTFCKFMRLIDPDRNNRITFHEFSTFVVSLTPEEYLATDTSALDLQEHLAGRYKRGISVGSTPAALAHSALARRQPSATTEHAEEVAMPPRQTSALSDATARVEEDAAVEMEMSMELTKMSKRAASSGRARRRTSGRPPAAPPAPGRASVVRKTSRTPDPSSIV